ncbi:MAG: response regulator transcription factor [Lachnospiraceae bacterium]|nr:response regulator transcription factor [Lachnospiraceae bacterium]
MKYKILIVDDEPEIRNLLRLYLENEGFEIAEAGSGTDALKMVGSEDISLCLLDIMLPGMDGFHVLQKLRQDNNIPVIIISARDTDADKILGLDLGADDYLAKPFNPLEAVARVKSNIRRFYSLGADSIKSDTIRVRDLELDPESCTLKKGDAVIELTSVEYKLMEMFMSHPNKVFTKQQIYEYGWGDDYFIADNNIMVCISKLRAKLSDDPQEYIRTLRGLGYRLQDDKA